MNTDPALAAGLRQLFERCKDKAVGSGNGIVVPTKVIDELTKHAHADADNATEERVGAIRRAGQWATALKSAGEVGLVRTDLGDKTNPYADDLFVDVFTRFGSTYDMCLVTNDITLRLRVRLLGADAPRQLIAGTICPDGRIEVESAQALFDRATRKLARIKRHIDEGLAKPRDHNEVEYLEPLLAKLQELFQVARPAVTPTADRGGAAAKSTHGRPTSAFKRTTTIKPPDESLPGAAIPGAGESVNAHSSSGGRPLILGEMIGDGGEGRVYAVLGDDDKVVKIFDADHRTWHRKAKIELLLSRDLNLQGIGFPTAAVTNGEGDFVGYEMPRASGDVLQATIMRPARFKRTYPNWTKADLVDVCISFLEKVAHLHSLNILLGDINPKNLMVDANKTVWIIDADSWQIEGYPCPVGTPMFTASSITGEYAEALRTPEEERFAVATMLFMILITGQFPYARSGADGGDFATLIRQGRFAFQSGGPSDRDQPEGNWKYMWSHLPPKVKRLFWNTFHHDGSRHDRRPTANEWLNVFRDYQQFFGGADDFDPMSNDVYPFRFRAFRPDTPIKDCPQCHRPHAIVGIWDDDSQSHRVLPLCYDCSQNKTACSQCGKSKPAGALVYGGRCWECYQKRDHTRCANCGTETREQLLVKGLCANCVPVECSECRTPTPKSKLSYGRCSACQAKQNTLDPSRQCARCGRPFITYGNVAWHQRSSRPVPTSHKYGDSACVAPATTTRPAASSTSATSTRRAASSATRPTQAKAAPATPPTTPTTSKAQSPAKKSFWSRLSDWFWN